MSAFYLDSSALVKRYVTETGSAWVRDLCQNGENAVFISELALVEVGSALARRSQRKEISDAQRQEYLDVFVHDCAESYHLIPAGLPTIERGLKLTQQHFLRGYDAVQLACALTANDVLTAAELPPLTFVSADGDLLDAAVVEGLDTANPNRC
jgi:hypothetical protein